MIFDRFYDEQSGRDAEGIYALKVLLNSKQVQKDVRKNFYAAEHFLDKVLDSYLLDLGAEALDVDVGCEGELQDEKGMHLSIMHFTDGLRLLSVPLLLGFIHMWADNC